MKIPPWLKIALPIGLLAGLAFAAMVHVLVEEPPPDAQPAVVQARLAGLIRVLRELAEAAPSDGCREPEGPEVMLRDHERQKLWWDEAERRKEAFADPAILGVEVSYFCGSSTRSLVLKEYAQPMGSRSRAQVLPDREWPSVSVWHSGRWRLYLYEDRFPDLPGDRRGIRLFLDLDRNGAAPAGIAKAAG